MFSGWTERYWGGHATAGAGALFLGSIVRIWRRQDARYATVLGSSAILLGWTRPFEGLLVFGAACLFLAEAFIRSEEKRSWLKSVAFPVGAVLMDGAVMTGVYCHRMTGSPLKLPYSVNREIYGWPMTLPWMQPRPVQHRHREHALYYAFEHSEHQNITDPAKFPLASASKAYTLLICFLGPLLGWPLVTGRLSSLDLPERRLLLTAGAVVLAGVLLEQTVFPHYMARADAVLYALVVAAWRAVQRPQRLLASGTLFVSLLPLIFACRAADVSLSMAWKGNSWCDPLSQGSVRARIQQQIEANAGRHVAIVRYARIRFRRSLVFNSPDIDSQRVIWAQDMREPNRELLEYYPDRTFWVVEPDAKPPRATIWKKPQLGATTSPRGTPARC